MQYLGRASISANGTVLDSKPGASIDLGGTQRDSVVNDHTMGYSESPKPSKIECTIAVSRGVSVEDIRNMTDATVVFECDTGQSYIVKDAFMSDTLSIAPGDNGGVKVVIMGDPAEEIVS